jgi:hypothetical protein
MNFYKVSVSVYFVSEGQITQPSSAIVGQVVSGRNLFLFFTAKLDNSHFDLLLPVKEKEIRYY